MTNTETTPFILNSETCLNLINILKSNDTSNLDVAEETIRHIDVENNLPYLLIMFKESNIQVRDTVFIKTIKEKLNSICKIITFDEANQSITYDQMFEEIQKHKVDAEAMQFFLDRFSIAISAVMQTWGFSFLSMCDLKIVTKQ